MNMMNSFGVYFNMLFWILIIGFVIYGVILLIIKPFEKNKETVAGGNESNSALNILKERYARGEISDEEYEHKKRVLQE